MIIEQPEAFKTWLTAVLKPMCDADPGALAKYVLALIKRDKSEEELQKIMIGQLQVFLEQETESFVNLVLHTLETQDYLTTPVIPNANPPNPAATASLINKSTTTTTAVATNSNNNSQQQQTTKESFIKETTNKPLIVHPNDLPNLNVEITTTTTTAAVNGSNSNSSRKDEKSGKGGRRHRSPSPRNRTRSRSRSWDRTKQRSKSREKRERPTRSWRNKSPPRRYSRRSRTPSINRLRSRSRSPRGHQYSGRTGGGGARYRNRTPPLKQLSRSRSRSPVGDKRGVIIANNKENINKELSRIGTPTQDSNHGDMDLRLTNSTQSIQSVIIQQNSKRRCRDFDEKGYCMRGEMCPFDHGIDPVVLEDAALSSVLTYNPNTTLPSGGGVGGGNDLSIPPPPPPVAAQQQQPIATLIGGGGQRLINEYNPQAPQIWNRTGGGGGFRGIRPPPMLSTRNVGNFVQQQQQQQQQSGLQRELVPVPVVMDNNSHQKNDYQFNYHHNQRHHHHHHQQQQQQHNQLNNTNNYNPMIENDFNKKKTFDFNRLGPRSNNNNNNTNVNNIKNNVLNCSLELKKIPQGLNSIQHLNNHFSKFGKTINIQVNYDGDPEAAIVTFSSHAEANAAYRSTEAVLNNRFIKVFWHNVNNDVSNKQDMNVQQQQQQRSIKERLGVVAPNTNKVLNLMQLRSGATGTTNTINNTLSQVGGGGDVSTTTLTESQQVNTTTTSSSGGGGGTTINVNDEKLSNNNNENNSKLLTTTTIAQTKLKRNKQELLLKFKKNQDEQRKEVLKLKHDLIKRKQELLDKQLQQQKVLLEKVDKMPAGQQRDVILETIKKSQESIETIKKDLLQATQQIKSSTTTITTTINNNNNNNTVTTLLTSNNNNNNNTLLLSPSPPKKLKEDVQREMLDAELDLITKQQEGADTSELQKKLYELKAKAAMTKQLINNGRGTSLRGGIIGGGGNGGGNRRFNLISRHLLTKNNLIDNSGLKGNIKSVNKNSFQKHTIDHRPTRLLVSGYETEEQDSVLQHFQQYGEVVDYEIDSTLPSTTLNYKTRKEAEMALLKGKHFQDRTLSITWSNNLSLTQIVTTQQRTTTTTTTAPTTPTTTIAATEPAQADVITTPARKVLVSESEEDRLIEQNLNETGIEEDLGPELSEEVLLQDDEEEEEESEDRSWRR